MSLTIATYNVNGVNGRLPRLLDWLEEKKPDVACLQELKTDDTKFPWKAIQSAGYGAVWHGQRAHHGVAVLARDETPRERRRSLPGTSWDTQARFLEVQVKGMVVASVYLPNGNPVPSANFEYKLRWFELLVSYAQNLSVTGLSVVLAGDLNVVPSNFDIYNPVWWQFDAVMQPQARDAYRRLLSQGWMDVVRHIHPRERMYTYWVNEKAFQRNRGMRLDFVLVNSPLQPHILDAGVDASYRGGAKPSDHAPAWIRVSRVVRRISP